MSTILKILIKFLAKIIDCSFLPNWEITFVFYCRGAKISNRFLVKMSPISWNRGIVISFISTHTLNTSFGYFIFCSYSCSNFWNIKIQNFTILKRKLFIYNNLILSNAFHESVRSSTTFLKIKCECNFIRKAFLSAVISTNKGL